ASHTKRQAATTAVTSLDRLSGAQTREAWEAAQADGQEGVPAQLTTESNVRRADGTDGHRSERDGSMACGQTQRRLTGHRRDDHQATTRAYSGALGVDSQEAAGWEVCAQPSERSGNTQSQRRRPATGHPDGEFILHLMQYRVGLGGG